MRKSLEQVCLEAGLRLTGGDLKGDWFLLGDITLSCGTCAGSTSALFGSHENSGAIDDLHEFQSVCRKCGNLTTVLMDFLQPSVRMLVRLDDVGGGPPGCTECSRIRLGRSLDENGQRKDTKRMPIVPSSRAHDASQVVPVLTLSDYFTQDFVLSVPPWQREYTWDATKENGEVAVLLDDLKQFVEEDKTEYLLGAVILCDTDDPNTAYLIDGQQRTVTLTLLLMCAYQYLKRNDLLTAEHFRFQNKLYNMITGSDHGYKPHVNFTQKNANEILAQIWDWMDAESDRGEKFIEETETYSKTQNNLLSVVRFISKQIKNGDWFPEGDLIKSLEKILDGVKIIQIRLDSKREAIQAYDRINHRGMRLNDADLIKNQLFELVDDKVFDEISESWQGMVETLQKTGSSKLQDPKYLIRAHAWTIWDKKTSYDDLSDEYKKNYFNDERTPSQFAQELELFANSLAGYTKHKHLKFGDLPLLLPPQNLGSVQHFPVLLAAESIGSKDVFEKLYHQVATRTLLYVLSKERPPEFESYIPKWATAIRKAGKSIDVDELDSIYKKYAFGPEGIDTVLPKLINNLHLQVESWRVNNSADKKKIRASLALMSWWMDQLCEKTFPEIDDFFKTRKPTARAKGWDIEHIAAIGYVDEKISLDQKHSIGNLALLSPQDQRGAKNDPPQAKSTIYSHSVLVLSKTVTGVPITPRIDRVRDDIYRVCEIEPNWSLEAWSPEAIKSRMDFYKSFLTQIVSMKLEVPK